MVTKRLDSVAYGRAERGTFLSASAEVSASAESKVFKPGKSKLENWLANLCSRLEAYEASDPAPFGPLVLAFCIYAFIVFVLAGPPLWHDELYTYYIAKSPNLGRLIEEITHLDLQPPLQYVFTRISLTLLGDSPFATRVPSFVAFTVASVCLYYFVRRRLGRFYALTAMLVFWLTPFLQYATQARPYALQLGFFCVALLGWQTATEGKRRPLGLCAIGFGVWGMLLSHVFSPLLVAVLGLAELVRTIDRRNVDWPIWIALTAPLPFMALYIPMFRKFQGWTALPPEFQASGFKIISFYLELFSAVSVVLFFALVTALLAYRAQGERSSDDAPVARKHEIALVLGLLLLPVAINLALMRTHGAFWPRYCIPTGVGFSLLLVYILGKLTNGSRAAAAITAVCVLVCIPGGFILQIAQPRNRAIIREITLKELDPRLLLVDASGLTFVEMNKREDAAFLSRLYYLTDREAALHYAHATIFEGMGTLHEYWPIRGNVSAYHDFVRQNSHFFVLGMPDYPEDWLIPKLMDDGAELAFKGELRSNYKDHMIFEVTMPAAKTSQ